jgi:hypothetical protein
MAIFSRPTWFLSRLRAFRPDVIVAVWEEREELIVPLMHICTGNILAYSNHTDSIPKWLGTGLIAFRFRWFGVLKCARTTSSSGK